MDLGEVYKRARPMYEGKLEHTFVVLKENYEDEKTSGSNREPIGVKRPASDMDGGINKKQAK